MSKDVDQSATLWTSLYHPDAGVPDHVIANQHQDCTNIDIFQQKPDAEAIDAFRAPLDEHVYAVSVG